MFTKLAAKWMDMYSRLSPAARARIMKSGIVKSEEDYVRGFNMGSDNIFRRLGYTPADIEKLTMLDRNIAIARVKQDLAAAIKSGDAYAIQRQKDVLDALTSIKSINNPIAYAKGVKNPRSIENASIHPALKVHHTEYADPSNKHPSPLLTALIRRHEAYEALATEKNMRRLAKNPEKYRDKAVDQARKREENKINRDIAKGKTVTPSERAGRLRAAEISAETGGASLHRDYTVHFPPLAGTPAAQSEVHSMYATQHPGRIYCDGGTLSGHADMDVLIKERKLIDRTPYLQDGKLGQVVAEMRKDEHAFMDAASGYNPATAKERFGKKDAKNLKKNMNKPITINGVTYTTEL